MDSTNSGSTQSSNSSDNQPYDSPRAESISSFLNLPPPQPPPTTSSHHLLPSSSLFDPLSPYFSSFSSPPLDPNPLSLDISWPKPPPSSHQLPSEPNCTTTAGGPTPWSSHYTSPFPASGQGGQCSGSNTLSQSPAVQPQPQPPPDHHPAANAPRSSKKRSRASRRAPTTVLTTDTTNFRAMVQEFTGFPAPPFGASPFPRPRLDFFHAAAAVPPYLLSRPFAQKFQAPSLGAPLAAAAASSTSSSMADAIASITRTAVANANASCVTSATCPNPSPGGASAASASSCYQLPSFDLLHQDLPNVQTPSFTLERLLQSSQPAAASYSLTTVPTFGVKPQGPSDNAVGDLGSGIGRADGLSGWADGLRTKGGDRAQLRLVDRKNGNS